jgi:hypothetical protein
MRVRLQLGTGRRLQRRRGKNRQVASALGALLMPVALMGYVMGIWRLASDMGVAGAFTVGGLFSHWQVWMVSAVAVHVVSYALTRYGRGGELQVPGLVTMFPRRPAPGIRRPKTRRA